MFLSASLVVFAAGTVYVVSWISTQVGTALDRAEAALVQKNDELGVMNEELVAAEEELRAERRGTGQKTAGTQRERGKIPRHRRDGKRGDLDRGSGNNNNVCQYENGIDAGYSKEELIGRKSSEFLDDEEKSRIHEYLERRKNGISENFEIRFVRKDGSSLWAISSANPLTDREGKFLGSQGLLTDITDRKRAEEALRESETKYRNLFEKMTEGFALYEIICDERNIPVDCRFLDINPAFES